MIGQLALFLAAGVVGGVVNSMAGGAKLFVFPMLLSAGLPPIAANATGTVAVWPAQAPAAWVYRKTLLEDPRTLLRKILPVAAGALFGVFALIQSSEKTFLAVIPVLLLIACTSILLGNRITQWVQRAVSPEKIRAVTGVLLFACGVYGGFFGAGVGFLLIAVLSVSSKGGIRTANAEKNLISFLMNTTAVIPLSLSGLVDWVAALTVLVGGLAGGYMGGRLTSLVPETLMRALVAGIGLILTVAFLMR